MALTDEEIEQVTEIFRQEANATRQAKQNFRAARRKAMERQRQALLSNSTPPPTEKKQP
jgi:hypothetical protein